MTMAVYVYYAYIDDDAIVRPFDVARYDRIVAGTVPEPAFALGRIRFAQIGVRVKDGNPFTLGYELYTIQVFDAYGHSDSQFERKQLSAALATELAEECPAYERAGVRRDYGYGPNVIDLSELFVLRGGRWRPTPAERSAIFAVAGLGWLL